MAFVISAVPAGWFGDLSDFLARWRGLAPVVTLGAGLLFGLVAEKIIFAYLEKLARKTRWEADDLIVAGFRGMPLLWCFLAGAYFSVADVSLLPRWERLFERSLLVVFLASATIVCARIAASMVALYSVKSEGLIPSTSILRNLTALAIFVCGALVILDTLGVSITPVLTALGVGGLAVALALQDTLSNLFAGIQILASRQVRVGDYIKLQTGEEGYVTDIHWRNTLVRALANNIITIPNSKLASAITTNFYMPEKEMSVVVQVAVSYGSDLDKVERVTSEVGREVMTSVKGGVAEHQPYIRFHTFAESSINFSVILRAQEFTDQYLIIHEFIKRLQKRYAQEEINTPFPIRTVYLEGGAQASAGA